jgi:glycerol-3-phosphate dehydrogenase (NAD(P)+)
MQGCDSLEEKNVGVVGKGAFGTALSQSFQFLINNKINDLISLGRESLTLSKENIPDIFILAIPSSEDESVLAHIKIYPNSCIILTSKGIATEKLYASLSSDEKNHVFILSGPNIADQIKNGTPTATVLAGSNQDQVSKLQETLNGENLRIYGSNSPEIIQWSGILKNLLVFELGKVWNKLSPEQQSQLLMEALHAGFSVIQKICPSEENAHEFWGIAGLGDILLCLEFFEESKGSRNFRAGKKHGIGANEEEILTEFGTVEGLTLSKEFHNVEIPEDLDTFEMRNLKQKINNISKGESLEAVSQKNEHTHSKILFSQILQLLKNYEKIINKKLGENTKSWIFSRIFLEFIQIFGTENKNSILESMINTVLIDQPLSNNVSLDSLNIPYDVDEATPLINFLLQFITGKTELSFEAISKNLLNRNTTTEGIEKISWQESVN